MRQIQGLGPQRQRQRLDVKDTSFARGMKGTQRSRSHEGLPRIEKHIQTVTGQRDEDTKVTENIDRIKE